MSNNDGRNVNGPRSYQVRLTRFGSVPKGEHGPSSLTVYITATSGMQARLHCDGRHIGVSPKLSRLSLGIGFSRASKSRFQHG
jgi:hypothetical protein